MQRARCLAVIQLVIICVCIISLPGRIYGKSPLQETDNQKQLIEVARFGRGEIFGVRWSNDGKWIVVGTRFGAWLYEANNLKKEPRFFNMGTVAILSIAFTPDSSTLIISSIVEKYVDKALAGKTTTQLWDLTTGKLKHTFDKAGTVTFSSDGEILLSTYEPNELWNLSTDKKLGATSCNSSFIDWMIVLPSADAKFMVCVDRHSSDSIVRLIDLQTNQTKRLAHEQVRRVRFSPDGKTLATAGYGIWLWDIKTLHITQKMKGDTGRVNDIAFSRDGTTLASVSAENKLRLWDVKTGRLLKTITTGTDWPGNVTFSPDGSRLVTGGMWQPVQFWDVASGNLVAVLDGYSGPVLGLALSHTNTTIASGDVSGRITLWDIQTGTSKVWSIGKDNIAHNLHFNLDDSRLLSNKGSDTISIWDGHTSELKEVWTFPEENIRSTAISPDGTLLALGGQDHRVNLVDTTRGKITQQLGVHSNSVSAVVFSPDGKLLASGDWNGNIYLWDVQNGKGKAVLEGDRTNSIYKSILGLAFSPDSKSLASASFDKTVQLWNVENGKILSSFAHIGAVTDIAFSPDGRLLASVGDDQRLYLWDVQAHKTVTMIDRIGEEFTHILWTANDNRFITANRDGTVRLWEIR